MGGDLKPGSCGTRLEDGVNLDQALAWNGRTCRSDAKGGDRAGDPREIASTDGGHRGRTVRSRVEGAVMALDQRAVVFRLGRRPTGDGRRRVTRRSHSTFRSGKSGKPSNE